MTGMALAIYAWHIGAHTLESRKHFVKLVNLTSDLHANVSWLELFAVGGHSDTAGFLFCDSFWVSTSRLSSHG